MQCDHMFNQNRSESISSIIDQARRRRECKNLCNFLWHCPPRRSTSCSSQVDVSVIKQRLVCFLTLAKSMMGEEIARELISAISIEYGITSDRLLAAMRD